MSIENEMMSALKEEMKKAQAQVAAVKASQILTKELGKGFAKMLDLPPEMEEVASIFGAILAPSMLEQTGITLPSGFKSELQYQQVEAFRTLAECPAEPPPAREQAVDQMTPMRKVNLRNWEDCEDLAGGMNWSAIIDETPIKLGDIRAISTSEVHDWYLARGVTKDGRWFSIKACNCDLCGEFGCHEGSVEFTFHDTRPPAVDHKLPQKYVPRGTEHPKVLAMAAKREEERNARREVHQERLTSFLSALSKK